MLWNERFAKLGLKLARSVTILAVLSVLGCGSARTGGGGGGDVGGGMDNGNVGGGSDDGGTDNGGGGDGGSMDTGSGAAIVKTNIIIGSAGKVDAGDDLIVYGIDETEDEGVGAVTAFNFNQPVGVHYIIPSQVDTQTDSGVMIPGSDVLFGTRNFKVVQKKVALVRSNGVLTIFDTEDGSSADIPGSDITMTTGLPVTFNTPGQMVSDGPYLATMNDPLMVADGHAIKVVDTGGPTPEVLSFVNADADDSIDPVLDEFQQVAIDAEEAMVVAVADDGSDDVLVWNLNDPTAPPQRFDFGLDTEAGLVSDQVQIQIDGRMMLYHDTAGFDPDVRLFNFEDGSNVLLDRSLDGAAVTFASDKLGFFMFAEDADREEAPSTQVLRTAIGTASTGEVVRASQIEEYPFRPSVVSLDSAGVSALQDECLEPKRVGYGESICVLPDGSRWFVGGTGPVRAKDYILTSTGGAFTDLADPEQTTVSGSLQGSDLVCTSNVVAFRGLREFHDVGCITSRDWVVSFIVPDRLSN